MNEEWARRVLAYEDAGQDVAPAADPQQLVTPLSFTPEVSRLSLIADRLMLVVDTLRQVNGGSPTPFQPLPFPTTAIERLREDRIRDELADLDRLIRGGATPLD